MDDAINSAAMVGRLTPLDVAVVVGAIALLLVIAYVTGRREEDTRDFFLGKRSVPWIVACLSFVAAEISAVTIVSVPGRGYATNLFYLQMFLGSAAAKVLIAFLFIPVFYKHDCTTIYEFLRHRFGPGTRYAGSIFFFITRVLASAVRLMAACGAIVVILLPAGAGTPEETKQAFETSLAWTLAAFTVISIAFIAFGGIKAVMWTGAYEALVFYGAAIAVAVYIVFQIPGGLGEALRVAGDGGRLALFNWKVNLSDDLTFWGASLNAFLIGMVVFGTDQDFMQRLLSVKTRRTSQKTLVATILAALPLTVLYIGLGTLLFAWYHYHPGAVQPGKSDQVLSFFAANILPGGLRGLVLAAVLLASIDSPLMSLSSSFVTDIYRPLINHRASERHCLWVSRAGVVVFGVLLALIAWGFRGFDAIVWVSFQIISITGGPLLGIFLLGLLTRRVSARGNVAAMILGAAVAGGLFAMTRLAYIAGPGAPGLAYTLGGEGDPAPILRLGWTWIIVVGTLVTFALGYVFGRDWTPGASAVRRDA